MIHVRTLGSHDPQLLLLHGWGQRGENMMGLAHLLASHATVHVMDLPGFGASPRPDSCWGSYDYAEGIQQWLKEKGITSVGCIGHSFGGKIALCLASRYPDSVNQLALLASSGVRSALPLFLRIKAKILSFLGRGIKTWDSLIGSHYFETTYAPFVGSSDYLAAGKMRDILVRTIQEDLSPLLKTIHCPTLLLWGEKDTATPPSMAKAMASALPHSKLLFFPGKNHYLLHDVSCHLMARYLIPFFSNG